MSLKSISDIQQMINNRADKNLKDVLRKLNELVYNGETYQLLKDITLNVGTAEKPKNITLCYIFSSDGFQEKIIEKNTERYRTMEAESFFKKVESLREDVDALLDNANF